MLPRRDSERESHPLAQHLEVLTGIPLYSLLVIYSFVFLL